MSHKPVSLLQLASIMSGQDERAEGGASFVAQATFWRGTNVFASPLDFGTAAGMRRSRSGRIPMARRIKDEKVQKINLMLSQAVTAMRVNERLLCELLRWAAEQCSDQNRFIHDAVENARNDLIRAGTDESMTSLIATHEALEYLDHLATEIRAKGSPAGNAGEGVHPQFL
ncbi:hypothetical protein [Ensifer adhaerens]|uniref:Uncharacterized protein n=1 Tax=Ensifer adhaerens TaxID=106592 RepID=A0A9Q8YF48_ENSAD|nr:hypothetical protein [Ensifer adhaerens]USJ27767.1 hypothetical protein NE863_28135 [Ensifer adhaerens]